MAILVQSIIPAKTGRIIFTANTSRVYRLFVTMYTPGNKPVDYTNIPMQGDQMYTYALSRAGNIVWDDTCDIALLPPGVTTPSENMYILYNSQIPHTLNYIDLNLGVNESIYVYVYRGDLSFTVLG